MRYLLGVTGLCVVVVLAATVPLFAYHSFAAEYDNNKPFHRIYLMNKCNNKTPIRPITEIMLSMIVHDKNVCFKERL